MIVGGKESSRVARLESLCIMRFRKMVHMAEGLKDNEIEALKGFFSYRPPFKRVMDVFCGWQLEELVAKAKSLEERIGKGVLLGQEGLFWTDEGQEYFTQMAFGLGLINLQTYAYGTQGVLTYYRNIGEVLGEEDFVWVLMNHGYTREIPKAGFLEKLYGMIGLVESDLYNDELEEKAWAVLEGSLRILNRRQNNLYEDFYKQALNHVVEGKADEAFCEYLLEMLDRIAPLDYQFNDKNNVYNLRLKTEILVKKCCKLIEESKAECKFFNEFLSIERPSSDATLTSDAYNKAAQRTLYLAIRILESLSTEEDLELQFELMVIVAQAVQLEQNMRYDRYKDLCCKLATRAPQFSVLNKMLADERIHYRSAAYLVIGGIRHGTYHQKLEETANLDHWENDEFFDLVAGWHDGIYRRNKWLCPEALLSLLKFGKFNKAWISEKLIDTVIYELGASTGRAKQNYTRIFEQLYGLIEVTEENIGIFTEACVEHYDFDTGTNRGHAIARKLGVLIKQDVFRTELVSEKLINTVIDGTEDHQENLRATSFRILKILMDKGMLPVECLNNFEQRVARNPNCPEDFTGKLIEYKENNFSGES